MFQNKFVKKITTHILRSIYIFSENHAIYEIAWKNMVEPGRPIVTTRRKRFGYKHILRTCYTYRFSTATMVTRKRLIVTLS